MGPAVTGRAVVLLPVSVVCLGAALQAAWQANRRSTVAGRLPPPAAGATGHGARIACRIRRPVPPAWLERALTDAAVDVPAPTAWLAWLGTVVLVPTAAAVISGAPAALLVLAAAGLLPPIALRARRGRADSRIESELPLALESIARSLRSGASVRQAIGEAAADRGRRRGRRSGDRGGGPARRTGRLQGELATVAEQAGHGAGLVAALEALAVRRPSPGVRLAVAALCLGVDTGGAQARAVDGVAATMRERLAVEAEVRALSSQARMSALVIGLAPLGFGAFAAATDPRTSEFLLHTPGGLVLLCVGLLLDGAGWLWMQRLCRVTG
jgi:tight adherence protein B